MLGALLETILLIINAIAILNEKRFLKKRSYQYIQTGSPQWLLPIIPTNKSPQNHNSLWWWLLFAPLANVQLYKVDFLIPLNIVAISLEILGWKMLIVHMFKINQRLEGYYQAIEEWVLVHLYREFYSFVVPIFCNSSMTKLECLCWRRLLLFWVNYISFTPGRVCTGKKKTLSDRFRYQLTSIGEHRLSDLFKTSTLPDRQISCLGQSSEHSVF